MQISTRASDEMEVVRSMYPDAVIEENELNESIMISLTLQATTETLPSLDVKLILPAGYLPDDETETSCNNNNNSNNNNNTSMMPIQIQSVDFFTPSSKCMEYSKGTIHKLKRIQSDMSKQVNEMVKGRYNEELVFEVLNLLQDELYALEERESDLLGIADMNGNEMTMTQNSDSNESNTQIPQISQDMPTPKTFTHEKPKENLVSRCRFLIKWHHMLPGRQHSKESAVWAVLERSDIPFSVISLGKPSMGVIEGDYEDLTRFVTESGKYGKKIMLVREDTFTFTFDHKSPCSLTKTQKPKYLNPITKNKKNEKPNVDGLVKELGERYGENWANDAISELLRASYA